MNIVKGNLCLHVFTSSDEEISVFFIFSESHPTYIVHFVASEQTTKHNGEVVSLHHFYLLTYLLFDCYGGRHIQDKFG